MLHVYTHVAHMHSWLNLLLALSVALALKVALITRASPQAFHFFMLILQ